MNIENIRNDFPEMPEEIRSMIAQTVAEQVKAGEQFKPVKRNKVRRTAILAFAVALVLGVTALAAGVARLHSQRVGSYGAAVTFAEETSSSESASGESAITFATGAAENAGVWYDLTIEPGWLPEGLAYSGQGDWKYSFAETQYQGGLSLSQNVLDTGNAIFCELEGSIASQEELTVAGHEAVLIQRMTGDDAELFLDKILYVAYPEYNTVIKLYIGSDISREDGLKIAENLKYSVNATEERDLSYIEAIYLENAAAVREGRAARDVSDAYDMAQANGGSFFDYMDIAQAIGNLLNPEKDSVTHVSKEDVGGIYEIGETFSVPFNVTVDGATVLPVKVTDVQIAEDTSILKNPEGAYKHFTTDENGRLGMNTVRFCVAGDGVNTLGETVVASLEQQEKLVAVTLEITNDTGETLYDIGYSAVVLSVTETEDSFTIFEPTPSEDVAYEYWDNTDITDYGRMDYFDIVDEYGKNNIPALAPGETVELQLAFVVNECQADKLLLSMIGDGSGTTFSDRGLTVGYVDLRG